MEVKQTVKTKRALGVPSLRGRLRRPQAPLPKVIDEKPIDDEPIKPVLVCPIDDKPIQPILICPIPENKDAQQEILQRLSSRIAA